ncbi:MAG: hypothetical protein GY708_17755 [Actinomycetia bacterium]|nr:hypothetical protein [Actinomycetes bacterium]
MPTTDLGYLADATSVTQGAHRTPSAARSDTCIRGIMILVTIRRLKPFMKGNLLYLRPGALVEAGLM